MLLVDLDKFSKLFLAPELTRGSETSAAGILKNKNYIIIIVYSIMTTVRQCDLTSLAIQNKFIQEQIFILFVLHKIIYIRIEQ